MTYDIQDICASLGAGELARLIPVVADSAKEKRAVSVLLASFMAVEEFGKSMLAVVGAPASKRSRIRCLTEVSFKKGRHAESLRPDGLIVATVGRRVWRAIVEAKVGSSELGPDQVEAYLDLAKENEFDAVITISNQFAALPTHHPIKVSGHKLRSVSLYHWSWMFLVSEAVLLIENKGISDPDQAYILHELIRYLDHPHSGVLHFNRMAPGWKEAWTAARNDARLSRSDASIIDTCASWHQLVRYLALRLSVSVGRNVSVYLSRAHKNNPDQRLQDAVRGLVKSYGLTVEFDILGAASRLILTADLTRKTLTASMWLAAPDNKARASACVTWVRNQLSECEDGRIIVTAHYPRRAGSKGATLAELREDQKALVGDNPSLLPNWFEIRKTVDNATRFSGPKTFVEDAENLVLSFYRDVGQHLRPWHRPAPKMIEEPVAGDGNGDGEVHPEP